MKRPERFRVGLQLNVAARRAKLREHRHRTRQKLIRAGRSEDDRLEGVDRSRMKIAAAAFAARCFV